MLSAKARPSSIGTTNNRVHSRNGPKYDLEGQIINRAVMGNT